MTEKDRKSGMIFIRFMGGFCLMGAYLVYERLEAKLNEPITVDSVVSMNGFLLGVLMAVLGVVGFIALFTHEDQFKLPEDNRDKGDKKDLS